MERIKEGRAKKKLVQILIELGLEDGLINVRKRRPFTRSASKIQVMRSNIGKMKGSQGRHSVHHNDWRQKIFAGKPWKE
jgi:hypothetical protein